MATFQYGNCQKCLGAGVIGDRCSTCWMGFIGPFIETLPMKRIRRLRTAQDLREAGQTNRAIGQVLGVSPSRAGQMVAQAERIAGAREWMGLPWREYAGAAI
jgi:hypothetical protein